ncbi:signaling protein [Corynebacterium ulcerans]|uniref:Zinc metalloprotease Rip1 n=1 Tax=Corynebacterium ramonii TaxID=3026968 RepID=A0ABM5RSG9_9CORY|nr:MULTISPECIES: site-2 protease family protein [Corynebacterium]AIU32954.1 Zinc metalloprotease [Corynebacterium ramonii FRC0011]ESU57781.1 membrane-associated Zn-dependent metalloprotease [Corynebacterium ulcerans NCTC 12077]KKO85805.1 signaling protein [Corynebacterium ulcerans]KKO87412.1 signaling protein [Corynebacterium ulcerans]KPJ23993.1 signaling protein [Corynebacterium ulcerans]
MLSYFIGVAAFAVGIAVTIALHEWGHYTAARACGMRVRRYFIGFGPRIFSFKRGHTEYGFKAVPLGGFCDIAGMTNQDPVTPEEAPHSMMHKPWWQRIIVLLGGILMNILVALIVLYGVAITAGLPNNHVDTTATVGETSCVAPKQIDAATLAPCSGAGPAAEAGLKQGDRIVAIDGQAMRSFVTVREYVQDKAGKTIAVTVDRDGSQLTLNVPVANALRLNAKGEEVSVGAIGVSSAPLKDVVLHYNAISAVGGTLSYAGDLLGATVKGLVSFPAKIPGVAASILGGQRDQESPVSVVGASRIGGELAQKSLWSMFFLMLASLNLFLALFNLIPLPPLDGGHIAVVIYEKLRDAFRKARGLEPAGPADYAKLIPLTVGVAALLMGVGALVIIADVVNPIKLFG